MKGWPPPSRFSHRYLPDRQLPDKAVSVLDTACARLALGQNAIPPAIEDAMRTLDDLAVQTRVLEREVAVGADHGERLAAIAEQKKPPPRPISTALNARWEKERDAGQPDSRDSRQIEAQAPPHAGAAAPQPATAAAESAVAPPLHALRANSANSMTELDACKARLR